MSVEVTDQLTGIVHQFPDDTPPDIIKGAMARARTVAPPPEPEPGKFDWSAPDKLGRLGSAIAGIPGAIGTGIMNAPATLGNFVTESVGNLAKAAERAPTPGRQYGMPPEPAPGTAPDPWRAFYSTEPWKQAGQVLKPFAEGAANALTFGALSNLMPPPPPGDETYAARQAVGGLIGGGLSGGAAYKMAQRAGPAIAKAIGAGPTISSNLGPAMANIGVPGAFGAVPKLAEGDIPGAAQGAAEGGAAGLLGAGIIKGAGKAYQGAANRLAQIPLRVASKEIGGAKGVIEQVGREAIAGRTPGTSIERDPTLQEGGETIQKAGLLAGKTVRAEASALRNEAENLFPRDIPVAVTAIDKIRSLVAEENPALRTTTGRKLGAVAEEFGARSASIPKGFTAAAVRQLEVTDPAMMKVLRERLDSTAGGATAADLIRLREDLGSIPAPNDVAKRLIELSKNAVDSDINALARQYPDGVRAYRNWQKFYGMEVGQYHDEGAQLRKYTNQTYGRQDFPASEIIPDLVKLPIEKIQNVKQGIRKGPNGPAAIDNIEAASALHLIRETIDPNTNAMDARKLIYQLRTPALAEKWREVLGPRYQNFKALSDELAASGFKAQQEPGALRMMEGYHILRGGSMAPFNPAAAAYHFGQAGIMILSPRVFANIVNNRVGARLLAKGIIERPGTARAQYIQSKIAEMADKVPGAATDIGPPPQLPPPETPTGPGPSPRRQGPTPPPVILAESGQRLIGEPLSPTPFKSAQQSAQIFEQAGQAREQAGMAETAGRAEQLRAEAKLRASPRGGELLRKQLQSQSQPPPGSTPLRQGGAPEFIRLLRAKYAKGGPPLTVDDQAFLHDIAGPDYLPEVRAIAQEIIDRNPAPPAMIPKGSLPAVRYPGIVPKPPPGELPLVGKAEPGAPSPLAGRPPSEPPRKAEPTLEDNLARLRELSQKSKIKMDEDRQVGGLISADVKRFGKISVTPAVLSEIPRSARHWFTTEQAGERIQPLDNMIESLHQANLIDEPSYEAFMDALNRRDLNLSNRKK